MHLIFIGRMFGRRYGIRYFILYPLFLFALGLAATKNNSVGAVAIGIQLIILCLLSRIALRARYSVSFLASTLAIYISQLSFGMISSI